LLPYRLQVGIIQTTQTAQQECEAELPAQQKRRAELPAFGNGLTTIGNSGKVDQEERSNMETMNIALSESMKHFVQEQVNQRGYSSVSEYMRELIRADQKRKADERIDTLLLEGLGSGKPIPVTPEYWEEKKRRLTERLSKAIKPQ
jgi:antitoxin ParD1/3/4